MAFKLYLFLLLVFLLKINGQCVYPIEGFESTGIDPWTCMNGINYVSDVKDQSTTGMCWAFSTISWLETMYNILTRNRMLLSVEQVADNIEDFYSDNNNTLLYGDDLIFQDCQGIIPRPAFNGGRQKCAVYYISKSGIMTEYAYPFTYGGAKDLYNVSIITPIGIRDITEISFDEMMNLNFTINNLINLMGYGVILTSVDANDLQHNNYIVNDIKEIEYHLNHAILITGVVYNPIDMEYYLEFMNSWGDEFGLGGLGYIIITKNDGNQIVNNRGILTHWLFADVYDRYVAGESFNIDKVVLTQIIDSNNKKYNDLLITVSVLFGSFLIILITMLVLLCKKKQNNDKVIMVTPNPVIPTKQEPSASHNNIEMILKPQPNVEVPKIVNVQPNIDIDPFANVEQKF